MSDAFIEVVGTGKKLQTYENSVAGNDVHSEAVTPTDPNGLPFSNTNRFPVTADQGAAGVDPWPVVGPLTDAQLRAAPVPVSGTVSTGGLTDAELRASPVVVDSASLTGAWGYLAGVSGTIAVPAGGKVLQITAIAEEAAASLSINGGDMVLLPYGSTDKVSSAITIEPKGNLVAPSITFTATKGYFVEYVT